MLRMDSPQRDEWKGEYLKFKEYPQHDGKMIWTIVNNDEELLGHLEKIRVGMWMSWCLTLENGCYLSAGCQDEVRIMTRRLNANNTLKKIKSRH